MKTHIISVYEWMEDFDDSEAPDGAWQAMLEDSVKEYNETFGTNYDPFETWLKYIDIKKS